MNSVKLASKHKHKLFPLFISAFNPNNAIVLAKNLKSIAFGNTWEEYVQHSGVSYRKLAKHTLKWLKHAQDQVGNGGVGCYEFYRWTKGYPEVTGYIIPTFWDCYHAFRDEDLKKRAIAMADWELGIQKEAGGWEGYYEGDGQPPVVFNSGQVLRGLNRAYLETGEQKYLQSAIKAADWIVDAQDTDGSWTTANYKQMKRVYDTYVAAPLAQLWSITKYDRYAQSSRKNCQFAISNQHQNGWFDLCDNTLLNNEAPVTHTLAYTIDGLIETGGILAEPAFIAAGKKAADALLHKIEILPYMPARFDKDWKQRANYVCNTGNAQLGIIFMRLFELEKDPRYLNAALKIVDFLAYVQSLNGVGKHRKGGITGAYPVWGMYCPLKYPSWAAKYFIDLLLLASKHTDDGKPV
jgi:uncharacterized protein YyaL (SSP411 family)